MSLNEGLTFWIQLVAWGIAFLEITLALYTLATNPRRAANQGLALLLLLYGLNSVGVAQLLGVQNDWQTAMPTFLLAVTSLAVQPLALVGALFIIHPDWLANTSPTGNSGRRKFPVWQVIVVILFFLAVLPLALAVYDLSLAPPARLTSALYFTGFEPGAYTGGMATIETFAHGTYWPALRIFYFAVLNIALLGLLFYFVILDRKLGKRERRLAAILLAATLLAAILQVLFQQGFVLEKLASLAGVIGDGNINAVPALATGLIYGIVYAFIAYQEIISETNVQRGSLAYRIAVLVLVVSIPLIVAQVLFTSSQAGTLVDRAAADVLQQQNQALRSQVELWIDLNTRALADLALQRDIRSMDEDRQLPVLQALKATYPYMNVVAVTDMNGRDIARSDMKTPADHSARLWFRRAAETSQLSSQVLLGADGQPVLVLAKPVYEALNVMVGIVMFEAQLDEISEQFQTVRIGETGNAFLVNDTDQLIAHPNPSITSWLRDYSEYPPVQALRRGETGFVDYTEDGRPYRAYVSLLDNGWGVIVEQSVDELQAPLRQLQTVAILILLGGLIILGVIIIFTVRQGLQPVRVLTDAVAAIAAGNLDRDVPVAPGVTYTTGDEMGFLAQSFNAMTAELRGLIGGLEERVNERTQEVTRRSVQLEAAAQVARNAAGIRDLSLLLTQATELISTTFQHYHCGIFIIDDAREYAVLQAANSVGGQRMLARNHKLKVGQVGIVGYVAAQGRPRIALDVGEDAVFFNNPDLPQTRSEMALPLVVNDQTIGVLDVQSTVSMAFQQEDIDVLQILADQLALAIENTRLLAETQQALDELRGLYGERARQDWQERLSHGAVAYQYTRLGVSPVDPGLLADSSQERQPAAMNGGATLRLPIVLRDQQLGEITLQRDPDQPAWSKEEVQVASDAISQVTSALENARLLEEARARSAQLRLLQEVTAVAASHTNLIELLDNVSQKLRAGLNLLHCSVIIADQHTGGSTGTLVVNTSANSTHPGAKMIGTHLPLFSSDPATTSPFEVAWRERRTVANYDPQKTLPAGTLQNYARQRESDTMLVTPLITRGQVIGYLVMDYSKTMTSQVEKLQFKDEELQLFDQLSLQISSAMDIARTFEQTLQRAEREQRLGMITSRIRETLDIESILRTTASEVRQMLDVPEVTIQLVNPDDQENHNSAAAASSQEATPLAPSPQDDQANEPTVQQPG